MIHDEGALSTENLARASAAHPWRVVIIWVLVFVVAGGLAGALFMESVTTEVKFLNEPESERAQTFLEERLKGPRSVTVFGGFALGELVALQQFGFGLAVAVLVDATLVRTVLMPSVLKLLGDRSWYLPSFLGWLPDFRIEGGLAAVQPAPSEGGD